MTMQPYEDESLPPQLREALRNMSKRGPVVELNGHVMLAELAEASGTEGVS
jgi:hypothetical protein